MLYAMMGVAFVVIGFRLRDRRLEYALVLQGMGIGILYLISFLRITFIIYYPHRLFLCC